MRVLAGLAQASVTLVSCHLRPLELLVSHRAWRNRTLCDSLREQEILTKAYSFQTLKQTCSKPRKIGQKNMPNDTFADKSIVFHASQHIIHQLRYWSSRRQVIAFFKFFYFFEAMHF